MSDLNNTKTYKYVYSLLATQERRSQAETLNVWENQQFGKNMEGDFNNITTATFVQYLNKFEAINWVIHMIRSASTLTT